MLTEDAYKFLWWAQPSANIAQAFGIGLLLFLHGMLDKSRCLSSTYPLRMEALSENSRHLESRVNKSVFSLALGEQRGHYFKV